MHTVKRLFPFSYPINAWSLSPISFDTSTTSSQGTDIKVTFVYIVFFVRLLRRLEQNLCLIYTPFTLYISSNYIKLDLVLQNETSLTILLKLAFPDFFLIFPMQRSFYFFYFIFLYRDFSF